uniref:Uncharacterized protein n=1 Tax=Oryza glaberrima TaxID=4538 RepID=I1PJX8_ORYGL
REAAEGVRRCPLPGRQLPRRGRSGGRVEGRPAPAPRRSTAGGRDSSTQSPVRSPAAAMDAVDSVVDPLREFAKDSVRLVKRCHKPDRNFS